MKKPKNTSEYIDTFSEDVQFPLNEPIPYGLVKEIVLFRLKEMQSTKNKIIES